TSTTPTSTTQTAPEPIAPGSEPALAPTPAGPPAPAPATGTSDEALVVEPPPPVLADFAVAPATMPLGYSMAAPPVLSWSTSGGAAVLVTGPGVSSSAPGGSVPICPGSTSAVCTAPPGTHTYMLVVTDEWGQVVAQRSASLTIV
ncbi:MAG: hypothetical protein ACRDY4_14325, partial [Acidimicrobiia bacterium]